MHSGLLSSETENYVRLGNAIHFMSAALSQSRIRVLHLTIAKTNQLCLLSHLVRFSICRHYRLAAGLLKEPASDIV